MCVCVSMTTLISPSSLSPHGVYEAVQEACTHAHTTPPPPLPLLSLPPQGVYEAVQEARDLARPWKGTLMGNDLHPGAISLAKRDLAALNMPKSTQVG
jgi:hypothetical protein